MREIYTSGELMKDQEIRIDRSLYCTGCLKGIPDSESYFQGYMVPPKNTNKFGCAPNQSYCERCIEKIPHWSDG